MRVLLMLVMGLALSLGGAGAWAQQSQQGKSKQSASVQKAKKTEKAKKAAPSKKAAAKPSARKRAAQPAARKSARPAVRTKAVAPARLSFGQLAGLDKTEDPLDLKSSVALVIDQDTEEVLLAKNAGAVLPIASITKLMTALIVAEARQPLDEVLTVTEADIDTEKGSTSRLRVGTQLTRGEMLHLALMSSENRAANALGRNYPGGLAGAVEAMNAKAKLLGMEATHYVEPTGLSSGNQSSASDLARLVKVAYSVPMLRDLSTSTDHRVRVGQRDMEFRTTNGLVKSPTWDIGLQKTGYISEAGRCLVMQAQLAGRRLVMVFLDSAGRYSRLGDAERVRRWLATDPAVAHPVKG